MNGSPNGTGEQQPKSTANFYTDFTVNRYLHAVCSTGLLSFALVFKHRSIKSGFCKEFKKSIF